MSKKKRTKCVVCSSEDCDTLSESSYRKAKTKNLFDNFCTNLLSIKKLSVDNLSLCPTCLDDLERLMETKGVVDSAELKVRKLQGRILKELGKLNKEVNILIGRLKIFEENIDKEDGLCLLRSSISKVTKDLLRFRNNSVGRDCGNRNDKVQTSSQKTKRLLSSISTSDRGVDLTNCANGLLIVKGEVEKYENPDDDEYFLFLEPVEPFPEDNDTNELGIHESDSKPINDSPSEGKNRRKRKRTKSPSPIRRMNRIRKTRKVCSKEFVRDENDSSEEDKPSNRADDINYNTPSNKSSTGNDTDSEAGSEIETPRRRQKRSSSKNKQHALEKKGPCKFKRLPFPDTSEMSPFKKLAFDVLLRKGTWISDQSESKNLPGSAEYHLAQAIQEQKDTQIEYSEETKSLHLKGVQIHINEEEERIQCSVCPYSTQLKKNAGTTLRRAYRTTMKVLMKHFMTHLKKYHCPICNDSEAFHITKYVFHLKAHLNIHPYTCKICGMPLSNGSQKMHLWTHMNEEEKTEAVSKGTYKRPNNGNFPCSICGKVYKTHRAVKQHETGFHNKEKVLCVKCGEFIRKEYYGRHVKFICPSEDAPRLKCIYCENTYKLKASLDKHLLRTHSEYANERQFQCTVCMKKFKLLEDLNRHMKLHSTDMIYECGKGCGKTFSATRYWRKHERVCGTPEFEEKVAWSKRKQKRKSDEILISDGEGEEDEEDEEEDDEEDEVYLNLL